MIKSLNQSKNVGIFNNALSVKATQMTDWTINDNSLIDIVYFYNSRPFAGLSGKNIIKNQSGIKNAFKDGM